MLHCTAPAVVTLKYWPHSQAALEGRKVTWYQLLEHVLPFPYTEEAVLYTVAEEGGGGLVETWGLSGGIWWLLGIKMKH